jgi:HlyD family secretion protein
MQNTKNLSDQNTIRELNQMADVTNSYLEAKRIYELDSQLYNKQAIGSQEYQSSKNNYEYQKRRKDLSVQTLAQDSVSTKQQLKQMKESYEHMQNALSLMQQKVGDLIVRGSC